VQGGVETDVGIIDYAKAEPASVRGSVTSGCHPENGNQILLYQILGGGFVRQMSFFSACDGKPFSIPAAPGTYRLSVISVGFDFHSTPMLAFQGAASAERTPRSFGTVEFHLADGENREVEMKIFEGGRITGRVTCECRTPLGAGPERTAVRFNPLENMGLVAAFDLNAEGTFEGWASMWGPVRAEFLNLPQDLYVKKIAVDGRETGPIVAAPTGARVSIEIVLSDSPATIAGTVVREDKPVARAHVVAVPWPMRMTDGYPDFASGETGDDGAFTIDKLAPGTYKVVSVGPLEWSRKDEPGVVETWPASGDDITLAAKESRRVRLELKLQ
jgi:hypothetical protein